MVKHWLLKPRFLASIPIVLLLVLAIACGGNGDDEPEDTGGVSGQPTPTTASAPEEPTATPIPTILGFATPTSPVDAGSPNPTPTATPETAAMPAQEIKFGGAIAMQDYAAPTLRAVHEWGFPTDKNMDPLYNNLVNFDPETDDPDDVICDLCTGWEVSDGGLTYTFRLVENARWWDGELVTAEDVVFSFQSILDPDTIVDDDGTQLMADQGRSSIVKKANNYMLPWPDCCRAIDEYTVELKLQFATAAFMPTISLATYNIQAKHTVIDQGKIQTYERWQDFNGSGPFKLVSYNKDVSNEYTRNEDYWKEGYPRIDGMTHFIIVDTGTIIAAFKARQVLMTNSMVSNLSNAEALQLAEEMKGELTVYWAGPVGYAGLLLNTTKAPLDNQKVRKAIHLALHRQPFVETFSKGLDFLGTPTPPGAWYGLSLEESAQLPGFRESEPGVKHPDDIAEAQRLMAEAGFPRRV